VQVILREEDISMKKFVVVMAVVLTCSMAAMAAEGTVAEAFAGYQFFHLDTQGATGVKTGYSGWDGALQYNMGGRFGLVGDVSGNYGTPFSGSPSISSYTFAFGPSVNFRAEKTKPFVHALVGGNRLASSGVSETAFAMLLGGGVDVKATHGVWLRLGQFDYMYTKHDSTFGFTGHQNNLRYSAGVVFHL
jgi:opacity protein-like surface antigen